MTELEKLGIPRERIRLSQAAGYEPLATPDDQMSGGGYARVEISLLNETTGVKLAKHGSPAKSRTRSVATTSDAGHAGEDHSADAKSSENKHSSSSAHGH